MKQGYDVFGKAYGQMLRNDLHHPHSIDHRFLREMILLEVDSREYLYRVIPTLPVGIRDHELFALSQQYRGQSNQDSAEKVLRFLSDMAEQYTVPFEDMEFGGSEAEILKRGSDWCADLARVGLVLLNCLDIPARILHLANRERPYWGHVVVEAFCDESWAVCDFVQGYFLPHSAWELLQDLSLLSQYGEDYMAQYASIAINNYDATDPENDYHKSTPNSYYLQLIANSGEGKWLMGEDQ